MDNLNNWEICSKSEGIRKISYFKGKKIDYVKRKNFQNQTKKNVTSLEWPETIPYVGEVRGDRTIKCISRDIMNYIKES